MKLICRGKKYCNTKEKKFVLLENEPDEEIILIELFSDTSPFPNEQKNTRERKNSERLMHCAAISGGMTGGRVSRPQGFHVKSSDKLLSRKFMNLRCTAGSAGTAQCVFNYDGRAYIKRPSPQSGAIYRGPISIYTPGYPRQGRNEKLLAVWRRTSITGRKSASDRRNINAPPKMKPIQSIPRRDSDQTFTFFPAKSE